MKTLMTPREIMKIRAMDEEGYKRMATQGALARKISVKPRQVAMTLKSPRVLHKVERLKARKKKRRRRRRV